MSWKQEVRYKLSYEHEHVLMEIPDQGIARFDPPDLARLLADGMPRAFYFNPSGILKRSYCRNRGPGGDPINVAGEIAGAKAGQHVHFRNGDSRDLTRRNLLIAPGARCLAGCKHRDGGLPDYTANFRGGIKGKARPASPPPPFPSPVDAGGVP